MGEYTTEWILGILGLIFFVGGLLFELNDWNNVFIKGWLFALIGLGLIILVIYLIVETHKKR